MITLGAIAAAIAFLVAAVGATLLPVEVRRGVWLPLHLALAGAATTAIAGVMPFFAAAFSATAPSDPRLRSTAVIAVAGGAIGVSLGVSGAQPGVAAAAGVLFVGGLVLAGVATLVPVTRGLGPGRGLVTKGYLAALGSVALGATLATLFVAGWPPIVDAWGGVRVAHAWLNLVGFVSVVIAATLLHFFPTVIGARIGARASARLALVGLVGGTLLIAGGVAVRADLVARLGALTVFAGTVGLAGYAWQTWRTRGRWTTDPGWHAFAMGGLISAIAWFVLGMAIATVRVLALGSDPSSWSTVLVAGPLVAGWMAIAMVASATHLIPAIGPGDQAAHARQRRLLGVAARPRLAAIDAGVAAISAGLPLGVDGLVVAGLALITAGLGATAMLLAGAIGIGLRGRP